MSYLHYLCLLAYSGVQSILCCVLFFFLRLVYSMLAVSLDCPFLIVHLVFFNVCLQQNKKHVSFNTSNGQRYRSTANQDVCIYINQGRIQDFKLGGAHLKKLRRAEGGARNFWGYFMRKITILRQKNLIFSNFRGGARRVRPPPPRHVTYDYKYLRVTTIMTFGSIPI